MWPFACLSVSLAVCLVDCLSVVFCFGQDLCSLICSSACCPVRKSILKTLESSTDSFRSLKASGRQGRLLRYPARDRLGRFFEVSDQRRTGTFVEVSGPRQTGTFVEVSGPRQTGTFVEVSGQRQTGTFVEVSGQRQTGDV